MSKLPIKPIESATVFVSGDRSVGIQSATFNLQLYLDLNCYGDDAADILKETRNQIYLLYSDMVSEKVVVMFDFEIEEQTAKELNSDPDPFIDYVYYDDRHDAIGTAIKWVNEQTARGAKFFRVVWWYEENYIVATRTKVTLRQARAYIKRREKEFL